MFNELKLTADRPVYVQVKDYIKGLIAKGALQPDQRLPSTRELAGLLAVSRNSVISAYEALEEEGYIYAVSGQGSFVAPDAAALASAADTVPPWKVDWLERLNGGARLAVEPII